MDKKRIYGQFFTKDALWLKPQVIDFIEKSGCQIAYDPFAGAGDLLHAVQNQSSIKQTTGLDIDEKLSWHKNDSLLHIPHLDGAIIVTNPPYLTNYSAARKKIAQNLRQYFNKSHYTDVYLIALDKMLAAQDYVVAIIPETFINSNYAQKSRLASLTILEENPFDDTENPVLVACFDGASKSLSEVQVYKNEALINDLATIEGARLKPTGSLTMMFNDPAGWLAVRCVDTTNPNDMIRFDYKRNIQYDWQNKIKISSRLLTLISVDIPKSERPQFIMKCNELLNKLREETSDLVLSPFKGNMKNGRRRRRLDFMTCRAIIEQAYQEVHSEQKLPLEELAMMAGEAYA